MFTSLVARNRGITQKQAVDTNAEVYFADRALELLADKVGTYDTALADLTRKVTTNSVRLSTKTGRTAQSAAEMQGETEMAASLTELKRQAAELNAAIAEFEAGKAEADDADDADYNKKSRKGKKAEAEDADDADDAESKKSKKAKSAEDADDGEAEGKKSKKAKRADDADDADDAAGRKGKRAKMDPDDDGDEDCPKGSANRSLIAAQAMIADHQLIASICNLSGFPEMTAKFITDGTSLTKVRQILTDKRAAETDAAAVYSGFGSPIPSGSLDQIHTQVATLVTNSGGKLSASAAMEKVLINNSALYMNYNSERQEAELSDRRRAGYIAQMQPRMRAYGLSAIQS
jgi:hypothetical protein